MELLGHEPNKVYGTLHYGAEEPNNISSGDSYTLVHTKNSDRAKFDGVSGHDQKHGQKFDLGPIYGEAPLLS
jgi:hypothetical protein